MNEPLKKVDNFKRQILQDLLSQCTEKQQKFFLRLYPDGVDGIIEEKIVRAIQQCEATIKKNREAK